MKKYLLTAAAMLCAWGLVRADQRVTPSGVAQALATADYGGVFYSTSSFPISGTGVNYSSAAIPLDPSETYVKGVFYGIFFSSGSAGVYDFVDVYDSTSSDRAKANDVWVCRVYNVNGTTSTSITNNQSASGFSGPPKPIRFTKGLITRASVNTYNMITTLYYREP